jgi:hypothetical protein
MRFGLVGDAFGEVAPVHGQGEDFGGVKAFSVVCPMTLGFQAFRLVTLVALLLAGCGGHSPRDVGIGQASQFAILAKTGVSSVGAPMVTGNLGISPASSASLFGFSLTDDASGAFSTSPEVSGAVYAADYAPPTPSDLTTAFDDMEVARADAAARTPDVTELDSGVLLPRTLVAGVYRWTTGVQIPADIKLDGSATDVWIFQIAQNLTVASSVKVRMVGGPPLPRNVFWRVLGQVDVGAGAHLEGFVFANQSVTMEPGSSLNGRLLSEGAIVLNGAEIVEPAP